MDGFDLEQGFFTASTRLVVCAYFGGAFREPGGSIEFTLADGWPGKIGRPNLHAT